LRNPMQMHLQNRMGCLQVCKGHDGMGENCWCQFWCQLGWVMVASWCVVVRSEEGEGAVNKRGFQHPAFWCALLQSPENGLKGHCSTN